MTEMRERYVVHRGQRIHYAVTGSGPLVLLAHGGLSDGSRWWDTGFADVFSAEYCVATPDSLGHGKSDKPFDPGYYDLAQRAGDLVAVADDLGHGRAHAIGYSMGGWTVSGVALHFPERLSSVTVGGWDLENGMATAAKRFGVPEITFDVLLSLARQQAPALLEWITPEVEPALRAAIDAIGELNGTADAVARLGNRALLWDGTDDPYHDPMEALAKREHLAFLSTPGDHVGTLEGHGVEAAEKIRAFIAEVEREVADE